MPTSIPPPAPHAPWLRVLAAEFPDELRCGRLRVVPASRDRPPFPVEAIVVEEDAWQVLAADPAVRKPSDHPIRLLRELEHLAPAPVGSVLADEGSPLRLRAVIHDLDQHPSCRPEWVHAGLRAVCGEGARRRLTTLALPLLGSGHGLLPARQCAALLREALPRVRRGQLEKLWLIVGDVERGAVLEELLGAQR